eukprot:scaffold346_cov387-Prasinococcus_capsulatus_cf.AAC.28
MNVRMEAGWKGRESLPLSSLRLAIKTAAAQINVIPATLRVCGVSRRIRPLRRAAKGNSSSIKVVANAADGDTCRPLFNPTCPQYEKTPCSSSPKKSSASGRLQSSLNTTRATRGAPTKHIRAKNCSITRGSSREPIMRTMVKTKPITAAEPKANKAPVVLLTLPSAALAFDFAAMGGLKPKMGGWITHTAPVAARRTAPKCFSVKASFSIVVAKNMAQSVFVKTKVTASSTGSSSTAFMNMVKPTKASIPRRAISNRVPVEVPNIRSPRDISIGVLKTSITTALVNTTKSAESISERTALDTTSMEAKLSAARTVMAGPELHKLCNWPAHQPGLTALVSIVGP